MNLIEISEQLKDVPDQLLMKEVQAPSGAYPAYLVVTEMSRRKRMRDQAMKEAPTTTVAQDLAQPSREQMMAAMAAVQQRMGQQSAGYQPTMDAMNLIYRQFFGTPYMQNRGMQTPVARPAANAPLTPRYPVRPV